jgi:hypothetical protein
MNARMYIRENIKTEMDRLIEEMTESFKTIDNGLMDDLLCFMSDREDRFTTSEEFSEQFDEFFTSDISDIEIKKMLDDYYFDIEFIYMASLFLKNNWGFKMRTINEIINELKISIDTMPLCTEPVSKAYLEGSIDVLKWALKYDIVLMDKPVIEPENESKPDYRFI